MTSVTSACLCWALLSVGLVALAFEEQEAESGQNVTLPCRVSKGKSIIILKWSRADLGEEYVLLFRDERLVPAEQHPSFKDRVDLQDRQMKDGDVSLILKDVTAADDGEYRCEVFVKESHVWELIRTISLRVVPPGVGGGGSVGLIVGLSVAAAVLLVAAAAGFVIYRKHKQSRGSY